MKITHLYVAEHHMKWNGIDLNPGDLYGHAEWYGLIYSHVPAGPNLVYFNCIGKYADVITASIDELPMVTAWETADGRVFFDADIEMPEVFMPHANSGKDNWDADIINTLLDECGEDEEVAVYIDGDEAYFFIHPAFSSPDFNGWGNLVESFLCGEVK